MPRSRSLSIALGIVTLLPASFLQAATDEELAALQQELRELRQRYEAQQKALMVLEQRVREVEAQPATPQPQRLARSPATPPPTSQGTGGYGEACGRTTVRRAVSRTSTTRPAVSSARASSAWKPG
jgi:hypothetical protein